MKESSASCMIYAGRCQLTNTSSAKVLKVLRTTYSQISMSEITSWYTTTLDFRSCALVQIHSFKLISFEHTHTPIDLPLINVSFAPRRSVVLRPSCERETPIMSFVLPIRLNTFAALQCGWCSQWQEVGLHIIQNTNSVSL